MPFVCAYSFCTFSAARSEVLATHIQTEHLRGLALPVILASRMGSKYVFMAQQTDRGKGLLRLCLLCLFQLFPQVECGTYSLNCCRMNV